MIKNTVQRRGLIWEFLKRDLFASYKKSFLGSFWIVISPLVGITVWIFFKHVGLLHPGDVGMPYPAYVLIGSLVWGLFMGLYTAASQTLTAGASFAMSVNYPREIFLFEKSLVQLVNFSIAFAVNLIVLAFFGIFPSWGILLFPLVALPLFFLAAAIGLIVALFSAVAIDTALLMTALMGLWLLITPVVYSDKIDNALLQLLTQWNPLTYLVCSAREIVVSGQLYHPVEYFICAAGAFLFFMIAWRLFYVSENKIIERMM